LDQVAFRRVDAYAAGLQVGDAAAELVGLARDLQQHPALVAGDVGAPDVGDDVELLAELVDDRLGHQVTAEHELYAAPGHGPDVRRAGRLRRPRARSRSRPIAGAGRRGRCRAGCPGR